MMVATLIVAAIAAVAGVVGLILQIARGRRTITVELLDQGPAQDGNLKVNFRNYSGAVHRIDDPVFCCSTGRLDIAIDRIRGFQNCRGTVGDRLSKEIGVERHFFIEALQAAASGRRRLPKAWVQITVDGKRTVKSNKLRLSDSLP